MSDAWEKQVEGKNVHSVYVYCFNCRTDGINFPLERKCGNCGSMETTTYYDRETISNLVDTTREEARQEAKNNVFEQITFIRNDLLGNKEQRVEEYIKSLSKDITMNKDQFIEKKVKEFNEIRTQAIWRKSEFLRQSLEEAFGAFEQLVREKKLDLSEILDKAFTYSDGVNDYESNLLEALKKNKGLCPSGIHPNNVNCECSG